MANHRNNIDWEDVVDRIHLQKKFLPIISDRVFFPGANHLIADWAKKIRYPYPFEPNLSIAQLAQYVSATSKDALAAKVKFLRFSKQYTLKVAREQAGNIKNPFLDSLEAEMPSLSFSNFATRLKYPQYEKVDDNPLQVLASLNLPIYVTTSYYDFLEKALKKIGKLPRTEICYWNAELTRRVPSIFKKDPDYKPSEKEPLVYHLHGIDEYPESLVLTEDDYMDFLVGISKDPDAVHVYIREAFVDSSLMLLGYQLEDWNFKTLFRGLIVGKRDSRRYFSISIQLTPDQIRERGLFSNEEVQDYLKQYFDKSNFDIYWGTPQEFTKELYSHLTLQPI